MPDSFATTQWSIVVAAGDAKSAESRSALAQLCETYWLPLYAYARRRLGKIEEARDLTQAFFVELLERNYVGAADAERGRFRAFLITVFKHFLSKERDRAGAMKRGGDATILSLDFHTADSSLKIEPMSTLTPEQYFDRQWAITLLSKVTGRLESEFVEAGKGNVFEVLRVFLAGSNPESSYAMAAERLGMSEGAAKKAASRMRARYRDLLREEIGATVDCEIEIENEIRNLFTALSLECDMPKF